MKNALIIALVCLNVVLLATLIVGTGIRRAEAQVLGTDYLVVPGAVGSDYDAVYILDLGSRRLIGLNMDRTRGVFRPYQGRQLPRDFGQDTPN